jgi:hypothetical protein
MVRCQTREGAANATPHALKRPALEQKLTLVRCFHSGFGMPRPNPPVKR